MQGENIKKKLTLMVILFVFVGVSNHAKCEQAIINIYTYGSGPGSNGQPQMRPMVSLPTPSYVKTSAPTQDSIRSNIDSEVLEAELTCKADAENADSACELLTNPVFMMGIQMFQSAGMANSTGKSMSQQCETAAKMSAIGASVNGGLGGLCLAAAGACHSHCGRAVTAASTFKKHHEEVILPRNQGTLDDAIEKCTGNLEYLKKEYEKEHRAGNYAESESRYMQYQENSSQCDKEVARAQAIVDREKALIAEAKRIEVHAMNSTSLCKKTYFKSAPSLMQAAVNAVNFAAANSCANQSSGLDIAAFCAKAENKSNPSCGGAIDCKTASGAMSRDCICADPKKAKTNPLCKDYRPPGPGGGTNTAGRGGNGTGSDALAGLGDGGMIGDVNGGNGEIASKSGEVQQGGGGGPGGGGAGGGINPDEKGGEAKDYKTEVNEGYIKGGKGGGDVPMYGSFGGSGGSGGRGESDLPKFDLSKYLPGQKKEQLRMMATQGLKAEGVTAASGPSIWEKVSNRMKAIRPNLK